MTGMSMTGMHMSGGSSTGGGSSDNITCNSISLSKINFPKANIRIQMSLCSPFVFDIYLNDSSATPATNIKSLLKAPGRSIFLTKFCVLRFSPAHITAMHEDGGIFHAHGIYLSSMSFGDVVAMVF